MRYYTTFTRETILTHSLSIYLSPPRLREVPTPRGRQASPVLSPLISALRVGESCEVLRLASLDELVLDVVVQVDI